MLDFLHNNKPYSLEDDRKGINPTNLFHTETYLSLHIFSGCNYGCSYCILKGEDWGRKATRISTPQEVIKNLLKSPLFIRDETILCIGARTEPFSEFCTEDTLNLINLLSQEDLKNPLCIITKGLLSEQTIKGIYDIKTKLKLIFCVSYSGLSRSFEPKVNDSKINVIDTMNNLKSQGSSVIHFWRPIMKENSTDEIISKIYNGVKKYSDASVCVGYKNDKGINWPEGVLDKITEMVKNDSVEKRSYPVFFNLTSCAISYVLEQPDYLANNIYEEKDYKSCCQKSLCPSGQRERCNNRTIPTAEYIKEVLTTLYNSNRFDHKQDRIILEGTNHDRQKVASLYHRLKFPVDVQGFNNSEIISLFQNMKAVSVRE